MPQLIILNKIKNYATNNYKCNSAHERLRLVADSGGNGRRLRGDSHQWGGHWGGGSSADTVGDGSGRWSSAVGASRPGLTGGCNGLLESLGLDEDRDDRTRSKTEGLVTQNTQHRTDLTGVTGDGYEEFLMFAVDLLEYLVQDLLGTNSFRSGGLCSHTVPELVILHEAGFNLPLGEQVMDVSLAATVIACVDADALTEQFFDGRLKLGARFGQVETVEGNVGGLEATGHRGNIIYIGRVDSLLLDELLPVVVGNLSLCDSIVSKGGIVPGSSAVAINFTPVTL